MLERHCGLRENKTPSLMLKRALQSVRRDKHTRQTAVQCRKCYTQGRGTGRKPIGKLEKGDRGLEHNVMKGKRKSNVSRR